MSKDENYFQFKKKKFRQIPGSPDRRGGQNRGKQTDSRPGHLGRQLLQAQSHGR